MRLTGDEFLPRQRSSTAAIVIVDSRQTPGSGQGVDLAATAAQLSDAELDRGVAIFSEISQSQGAPAWSRADVGPPERLRLYRATAVQHFVLPGRDERLPVRVSRSAHRA